MVGRLFLAVPRGRLRFVIVVFPDHTLLLFLKSATMGKMINRILFAYFDIKFTRLSFENAC